MYVREFRAHVGNRIGALVLGAALLAAAGVFLAFGFILFLGLMVAGLILGIGASLYRRLAGGSSATLRRAESRTGLDPSLEVSPPPPTTLKASTDGTTQEPTHPAN